MAAILGIIGLMLVGCSSLDNGDTQADIEPDETTTAGADNVNNTEKTEEDTGEPEELLTVRIAVGSTSFAVAGLQVAKLSGILERNGLDAEFLTTGTGAEAAAALHAGDVDLATTGTTEAFASQARGQDVRVAVNLFSGPSGTLVLGTDVVERLDAAPDDSVEDRLRALDGLTIASPSASSAQTAPVLAGAESVGVDVVMTFMDQGAMGAALNRGAIDGFMTGSPFSDTAIVEGFGIAWVSGPKGEFPDEATPATTAVLTVLGSYVDANPEIMRRLANAFDDLAAAVASEDAIVMESLREFYSDLDPEIVESAAETNAPAWTDPVFSLEDAEKEKQLLIQGDADIQDLESVDASTVLVEVP